jgi:hypothetical protein
MPSEVSLGSYTDGVYSGVSRPRALTAPATEASGTFVWGSQHTRFPSPLGCGGL